MDGIIHNTGGLVRNNRRRDDVIVPEVVPPDGGWGWVILVGNCILMFLLPTSPVCYGVVYLALVEQQGISNTSASGITAVLLGISTFLGPVSTAMSSFYSHRKLALIGVAFMSLGLLFCSFSLNIVWLYFSFVLIGFGNSLGTPQIFLIGQEYFHKKRVTANAVASASYTIGYVVLPILMLALISNYSIRGAFLVWAAIMLNGLVGAMLYQPVTRHVKPIIPAAVTFSDEIHTIEDNTTKYVDEMITDPKSFGNGYIECSNKIVEQNGHAYEPVDVLDAYQTIPFVDADPNVPTNEKVEDADSLKSIKEENDHFKDFKLEDTQTADIKDNHVLLGYIQKERPCSFVSTTSIDSYCTAKTHFKSMISIAPSEYFDVMGSWMSIETIDEFKPTNGSVITIPENDSCISPEEIPARKQTFEKKSHRVCGISVPYFRDVVKLEVLTSPVFLIIAISSAIYRQVYYGYSSFLPVVANQKQLGDHFPLLLLVLAVAEVISKVCTGLVADRGWIAARTLYMSTTVVNCFALILTGISTDLVTLTVATSILGMGLGVSSSLGPVLLVKYHSLELLPYSYGLMLLLSGVTTFLLFPIQGWTIDATGSANYVCYIFASLCIVPLILWSLMPIAKKHSKTNGKFDA